ncbi:hypothetical protein CCAX7_59650 [Capsulimonas corticalis]|uniref:Uncharacterized protein n=1 Tax=Capsulimonas corticalis TaxID=2219043 RepID=A0A402CZP7_9BACT|nr:helix-turn-helix transcriptional regulator [Capsulimonas corticalis]BDI33914.1 hypothetical protein CCAX7_59650 [Capsulimonas corticalis]
MSRVSYTHGVKKTLYSAEQKVFLGLLRQIRQNAGLSQQEIADRLEVAQSRISDYERGERQLDLMELRQYCAAAETSLEEFVRRFEVGIRDSTPEA